MPGYAKVTIIANLRDVEATIDQAKERGQYDGNEARYDITVTDVLDTDQGTAERYIEENRQLVEGLAVRCKEQADALSKIAAQKTVSADDVNRAQLSLQTIQQYTQQIHDDNVELNNALKDEYRGGWPEIAKRLLSDPSRANPYMAVRLKGINTGKNIPALTKRCDQYVKRGKEFLKQIIQTQKSGAVEMEQFQNDCAGILAKMTKKKDQIETLRYKVNLSIDWYITTLKKKKEKNYDASDLSTAQNRISEIGAKAKEARGIFKTMTVQYDGLKKRAKAAGHGWKEMALDAVRSAKSEYTAAERTMSNFNDEERECNKLLAKVKKRVG